MSKHGSVVFHLIHFRNCCFQADKAQPVAVPCRYRSNRLTISKYFVKLILSVLHHVYMQCNFQMLQFILLNVLLELTLSLHIDLLKHFNVYE